MYKYFFSYSHVTEKGSGFGNMETHISEEIKNIADIMSITRKLEIENNLGANTVVILNFIKLN